MQNIIIDEPYDFVPPHPGKFWPRVLGLFNRHHLRSKCGIEEVEFRHIERLQNSIAAGHGIMLTPNHCRPSDGTVILALAKRAKTLLYIVASWHVFKQTRLQSWLLSRSGVFSIYREGIDRKSLNACIEVLTAAKRPLVIFPEGVISRSNDRIGNLMEGPAFIARNAAKRRAKTGGSVVVHPIFFRYVFLGDLKTTLDPILTRIEKRLTWRPQKHLNIDARILKIAQALMGVKEVEYHGSVQPGSLRQRLDALIDTILSPLEAEWTNGAQCSANVVLRVKALRKAILPDLIKENLPQHETQRRWRHLEDCYLSQQLAVYEPGNLADSSAPERRLETVECFEEDMTDKTTVHRPMKVIIEVGEAIEVSVDKQRGRDPVMDAIESQLTAMSKA